MIKKCLCIHFIECLNINITNDIRTKGFSIKDYLKKQNKTIEFSSLLKAKLKFTLKTVNLKVAGKYSPPDCYKFEVQVNTMFVYFLNVK